MPVVEKKLSQEKLTERSTGETSLSLVFSEPSLWGGCYLVKDAFKGKYAKVAS